MTLLSGQKLFSNYSVTATTDTGQMNFYSLLL